MMTSCSTSPSSVWFILVPILLGACSDDGPSTQACLDEDSVLPAGHSSEALLRATVQVVQEAKHEGGSRTVESSVVASFTDTTAVEVQSRQPDTSFGGLACFGLTGAPTTTCRPGFSEPCNVEPLDVEVVALEGLSGGTLQLSATSKGKYSKEGLADPPFGQGDVTVKVTGRAEKGFFPTYEQVLSPLAPLQLLEPDPTGAEAIGPYPIRFRWSVGDVEQDAIVLDISSTEAGTTDKIQCYVKDDGCHLVQPDALDWLEIKEGDSFRVSITRIRSSVKKISGDTSAKLNVISRVRAVLTR